LVGWFVGLWVCWCVGVLVGRLVVGLYTILVISILYGV